MSEREDLLNKIESDKQALNRGILPIGFGLVCWLFDVKLGAKTRREMKEEYANYLISLFSLHLHEWELQQLPVPLPQETNVSVNPFNLPFGLLNRPLSFDQDFLKRFLASPRPIQPITLASSGQPGELRKVVRRTRKPVSPKRLGVRNSARTVRERRYRRSEA